MNFDEFDGEYVERLKRGDYRTELHFAGYFGELIELFLRSKISSPEEREDIRQETFIRFFALLRSPSGIRQPASLGALVLSICRNILHERWRKPPPEPEDAIPDLPSTGPSPLIIWIRKQERASFERILRRLSDRDRRLLRAIYWEEMDRDEICAREDVSRGYLRVLFLRARQAFKEEYLRQTGQPQDDNQPA